MARNPGGQPTKYKKEYCDEVVTYLADGSSLNQFCASIGIHRDTLQEWAKVHPEFHEAKKLALQGAEAWWERQLQVGAWHEERGARLTPGIVQFVLKSRFNHRDKDPVVINNVNHGPPMTDQELLNRWAKTKK
jgi:hypothetical protein